MYIYVYSTIQRCPNKIIKIFLIEDFFHLLPVSTTPVFNLELGISPWIFEKFETVPLEYSGAGGKLIHEKNQKQKISWHCPFKVQLEYLQYMSDLTISDYSLICNLKETFTYLNQSWTENVFKNP